jgi:hypothetical protein
MAHERCYRRGDSSARIDSTGHESTGGAPGESLWSGDFATLKLHGYKEFLSLVRSNSSEEKALFERNTFHG